MRENSKRETPNTAAETALDRLISYVLGHPQMSEWLKTALTDALHLDPISVLNELETLNHILRHRSEIFIAKKYNSHDPQ